MAHGTVTWFDPLRGMGAIASTTEGTTPTSTSATSTAAGDRA